MYCVACTWVTEGRKSGNCLTSSVLKSVCEKFIMDHYKNRQYHYEIVQREPWTGTIYLE